MLARVASHPRPSASWWTHIVQRAFASRPPLPEGPPLADFIARSGDGGDGGDGVVPDVASAMSVPDFGFVDAGSNSFVAREAEARASDAAQPKVYIETYGCQMNVADTQVVNAILQRAGYDVSGGSAEDADVVLINTCAIRDNAEAKVWHRLSELRALKRRRQRSRQPPLVVGVLGCMAERLKTRLLESDRLVDLVAGPDAYRDLPNLVEVVKGGEQAINVQLSHDETYADIAPVRSDGNGVSAYLSIMRGCNNMCTYCIVPSVRSKERSRDLPSIVDEVCQLVEEGHRDVVLLGQNVNSYHDKKTVLSDNTAYVATPGFTNLYRTRDGLGARFIDLLDAVSTAAPDARFRFTSPHPKDFPTDLLHLVAERPNISNNIHMPAQSGSTAVLERMRRHYTREAYIELVDRIRDIIPDVSISSDFISGFCGETEEDHQQTLSLMEYVQYDQAFMFAYSMRERTPAHRRYQDDVPEEVKNRRLREVIGVFTAGARVRHEMEVGHRHLVLLEGTSKRSTPEARTLVGRTHNNKRCVVTAEPVPVDDDMTSTWVDLQAGDFVVVDVESATGATLVGRPVARTTLQQFFSDTPEALARAPRAPVSPTTVELHA